MLQANSGEEVSSPRARSARVPLRILLHNSLKLDGFLECFWFLLSHVEGIARPNVLVKYIVTLPFSPVYTQRERVG